MSFVIGLDVSTTATKAILIDESGEARGVAVSSYGYDTPRPVWIEQDPRLWWDATVAAVKRLLAETEADPSDVDAIGLAGQMHGSVLLDAAGHVVRPAILWNDQRTAAECDEIRRRVGPERLIEVTGNDALTGFTAPKLLWVARHEPENWGRAQHVLLPKDYVRYRLTHGMATDVADGSGTILFDLVERTWSEEVLNALDIERALLPDTFEGTEITGTIVSEAAEVTGLMSGTAVVAGGGDQAANAVGVGAVTSGVVALSLGTSGVVFATTDGPTIEPRARVHSFCHAVPRRWHMMGVMLSAAGSLRWFRDAVAPGRSFEELIEGAAEIAPGADGLFFLPYLTGERTPHPDPNARGAFVGLTVRHDIRHMTRAVLEGVAFGLRDGLDLMTTAGIDPPRQIRGSGGGIRSAVWRQILADVLETEIMTVRTEEGAAYGAGLLAAVGAGWAPTVGQLCAETVAFGSATKPTPDTERYREGHAVYRSLYPALSPIFAAT